MCRLNHLGAGIVRLPCCFYGRAYARGYHNRTGLRKRATTKSVRASRAYENEGLSTACFLLGIRDSNLPACTACHHPKLQDPGRPKRKHDQSAKDHGKQQSHGER